MPIKHIGLCVRIVSSLLTQKSLSVWHQGENGEKARTTYRGQISRIQWLLNAEQTETNKIDRSFSCFLSFVCLKRIRFALSNAAESD